VFEDQYKVTPQKLGSGAYGQVHMAFKKDTGQQLACKIIDLRALRNRVVREAEDQPSRYLEEKRFSQTSNKLLVARVDKSLQEKIQEKVNLYNREARILETLCHVSFPRTVPVLALTHTAEHHYYRESY
jgi:protein-serine/threonine kinase